MAFQFLDLPIELQEAILLQYYEHRWSIRVLDHVVHGTLPIEGVPSSSILRTSRVLSTRAYQVERSLFSHQLVFKTSSTSWRTLARMRDVSDRLKYYLDHVIHLRFCAPPLFTSRIPWTELPALRKVDLDYSNRKANFRIQGTLKELASGHLDPMIVAFARDSERFDGPLIEDAGAREPSVGVTVIKKMFVTEGIPVPPSFMVPGQIASKTYPLIITARHRQRLEEIVFVCPALSSETCSDNDVEVVWTRQGGMRKNSIADTKGQR